MKTRVGIVGATGYTGLELLRLLIRHPEIEVTALTSQKYAGMPIDRVFPSLTNQLPISCEELSFERISEKTDFIFTAVPHKTAMETVPPFYRLGKRVVDLSADFRFKDAAIYERWYQKHTQPDLLRETVYGLPELHREKIRDAKIVGNPGCYPTGALLGLIPLVKHGLISTDTVVVDSKSGVSGAGRDVVLDSLFCEVNEGVKAYKLFEHRHLPEIEGELSQLARKKLTVTFVPHLIPMDRGILSTLYVMLGKKMKTEEVLNIFQTHYQEEPFVRIYPKGKLPNTRDVKGSNYCDIGVKVNEEDGRLVVVTAIDNLVKGASGQAVQNMNVMLGFPETMGLGVLPLTP
ncbi:MAG: N-acetyl-gamma-glutamyl-phosphate reductase [Deltaproteobacteria bacterium RBG_13_53_10]|nr:MAG: N-acetyl-gamma-glutamyl-phosphate reductase [Deltaproteobacteria bacterium RBG_13_53_10]